jgi:hypothetical protein
MAMTNEEIRTRGLAALQRELDRAGLARFLQMFRMGLGNYAAERGQLLKDLTLDDLRKWVPTKRARSGRLNKRK